MTAHSIPDDIREFIVQHIQSIAQLEALLLLLNNEHGFSLEECASRLYISAPECEAALQSLIASQFIQIDGGRYFFHSDDSEIVLRIKSLAEVYRQQLIPVTKLIHSKQERIQKFADAFRVRKEP
jgi:predicted transcriptional regulator